jgi:hypothetical protein
MASDTRCGGECESVLPDESLSCRRGGGIGFARLAQFLARIGAPSPGTGNAFGSRVFGDHQRLVTSRVSISST